VRGSSITQAFSVGTTRTGPSADGEGAFMKAWSALSERFCASQGIDSSRHASCVDAREEELTILQRVRGWYVDALVVKGWTPLHAAAFAAGGDVCILPGDSGRGKSSCAAVLASAGYEVSDELVLIKIDEGVVRALIPPLPLSLRGDTLLKLPAVSRWLRLHSGPPAGKATVFPPRPLQGLHRVAAVLLLERVAPGSAPCIERASEFKTARALMSAMARFTNGGAESAPRRQSAWKTLSALIDDADSYVLEADMFEIDPHGVAGRVVPSKGDTHG
jgi:hypothetical protein